MRAIRVLTTAIITACCAPIAYGQTVVVPETPYTTLGAQMDVASTAMLDVDSAIMVYEEQNTVKFQVVNINSGAVELAPTPVAVGVGAVVAVLGPDAAMITLRAGPPGWPFFPVPPRQGAYYVVNPLTGAITVGPVLFHPTQNEIPNSYRMAVADRSTVLISVPDRPVVPGDLLGRFLVVDPENGIVKVPLTTFEPQSGEADVVAIDPDRVAIVYTRFVSPTVPVRHFFVIVDPHTGTLNSPIEFDGGPFGVERVIRASNTKILIAFQTMPHSERFAGQFVTADVVDGSVSAPATFAEESDAAVWAFSLSPVMLGADAVLFPYSRVNPSVGFGPGLFGVFRTDGQRLLAEAPFNPEGPTYFVSAASSECRALLSYQDVNDGQKGKFQVLDFSDVCTPPPCPTEVTDRLNVFRSAFVPFLLPFLQLQLVLVHNPTAEAIPGPLAFAPADLQNAILFSSTATRCLTPIPVPFVPFHPGADEILSPNELTGGFLLFLKTSPDPITYTPRVLGGVPR